MTEGTNWIAETRALPPLEPEAQSALAQLSPATVPADTVLFRPGETVKGFVIVLSGQVDVYLVGRGGREILLYSVSPGQSCVQSTLGLLGGEDYSGEAIARTPSRLVLVPREMFLRLVDSSPAFRGFVFKAFATRMQTMMHLLDQVAFQRIEARIARCLLARAADGVLRATHAEIAVMIGSAREVVSRRLERLAGRGILQLERGSVRILDRATLDTIASDAD